jgi:hypothetical protein
LPLPARRRFQFCIERLQDFRRLFPLPKPGPSSFSRLGCPSRAVSRRTRCCGSEASEAIPFPGADSIFSSCCGAISGRLPFCRRALSRRDPGNRNASVQKIDNRLGLGSYATLSFSRLVGRSRARSARPRTRCCRFEAFEPIPFPGADSIFSSRCGAISGRLLFAVSLSRRDPGDRGLRVYPTF